MHATATAVGDCLRQLTAHASGSGDVELRASDGATAPLDATEVGEVHFHESTGQNLLPGTEARNKRSAVSARDGL